MTDPVTPTLQTAIATALAAANDAQDSAGDASASANAAANSATSAATSANGISTTATSINATYAEIQSIQKAVNAASIIIAGTEALVASQVEGIASAVTEATSLAMAAQEASSAIGNNVNAAAASANSASNSANSAATSATSATASAASAAAVEASLVGTLQRQGNWNASTNNPTLTSSSGTDGHMYVVSVAGTTSLNGLNQWNVGDICYFDGGANVWRRIIGSQGSVTSVVGLSGAVTEAQLATAMAGTSVANPGTGTLETLLPVQTVTGASYSYAQADLFKETRRSNSGSAMTDTLPASTVTGLVNGTVLTINNVDTTASITLSPGTGTSFSSGSTQTIGPGRSVRWVLDAPSMVWRATLNTLTALLAANNLSEVTTPATALSNLGGAPLASPTFTGTPAGPTATGGTNTTQLATTAFVAAAIAAALALPASVTLANVEFICSNGGSPLIVGLQGYLQVGFSCTIQSVTLLANTSGSVTIDIWKCSYANFNPGTHPVAGDSICASDVPAIASTYKYTDSTLTGWTTSISAGDILAFNVKVAATNIAQVTVSLKVQKT